MEQNRDLQNNEETEQYLDEKLIAYSQTDAYPFHMPGHKRRRLGDWIPEEIDITEITGFDNLHHAEGILREAQQRAAELFGADETFFLVNGSTAGLLAAVCGTVKKGGRLLMARNCHKAVYHAVYLMEAKTAYLYPEETAFGIQGSISPKQVAEMLDQYSDTEAVLLTSPTYDGVVSDIASIAEIVHAKGIPLIIDEAHGAHFGFSQGFPQKAMALGADLCIESVHKTLPAYTQSALLHYRKNPWVDLEQVKRYLGIYQSSSPSYLLMAGIDRCTRILREQGTELFAAYEERLHDFYEKCKTLERITVFQTEQEDGNDDLHVLDSVTPDLVYKKEKQPGIWDRDPSKILICAEHAGLHGQELAELLTEKYHLEMEMASGHYVTALTTLMDTQEGFDRLFAALQEIDRQSSEIPDDIDTWSQRALNTNMTDTDVVSDNLSCGTKKQAQFTTKEIYRRTEKVLEIAQGIDAPKETVLLMEAAGAVSGEFVYLYPPGIPILAPGERVTEEILETLRICRERNMEVEGIRSNAGETWCVILVSES